MGQLLSKLALFDVSRRPFEVTDDDDDMAAAAAAAADRFVLDDEVL